MLQSNLFSFDYYLNLSQQEKFLLNLDEQGRTVREILLKDIRASEDYLILIGVTSLTNLIDAFGSTDYPKLR
jgi:hypothetical protein